MLSRKTIISIIVICVSAVGIVSCAWVFLLGSQRKAIAGIEVLIGNKQEELIYINVNKDATEKAFLARMFLNHQQLTEYVVTRQQASDLSIDISRIAMNTGVHEFSSTNKMKSSYNSINECEYIAEGRIQLKFEGAFFQFAEFINELERFEPVIFIDGFSIRRSESNDDRHSVSIVVAFFVAQDNLDNALNASANLGVVGEQGGSQVNVN